ncbi:alpha-galactosidase [Treponema sp. HNW]|uniref:alpha-galactosidase n=1 Tax=Treponema sp. HNW TaxID=3116654 RepID=UPI003D0F2158
MIHCENKVFNLETDNSSYRFRVTEYGHLETLYYGTKLADEDVETLALKRTAQRGSSVCYDEKNPLYVLDNIPLQWSGNGRGDYRYCPAEIRMPDTSFTHDFIYTSHKTEKGCMPPSSLPSAVDGNKDAETLVINLKDATDVELILFYTVFPSCDVITRRALLINRSEKPLEIRRIMSMMIDLPDRGFTMHTFDGSWAKEAHIHSKEIAYGMWVNESTTGTSSNRHNPGFLMTSRNADEDSGEVYAFNLVYSGNHFGFIQKSHTDLIRIGIGISPHCFSWDLKQAERFETPEAVLSFSAAGFNGMRKNMHRFVNNCIVRGEWKEKERPVLFNNWEGNFFKFNRRSLLKTAQKAKKIGIELFVLDDGWFGERNSDTAGLGDYSVNTKKLPGGIKRLADSVRKIGLDFGLWFEPEMVNEDSDLFRTHPEWAVKEPSRQPVRGRHQLVLNLCLPEVRNYIVKNVCRILDEADISYVKWDMNRYLGAAFSPSLENQGEFFHRYVSGLYEILHRIFDERPHILLESCSSGGNRFDLGMLCFSPQIWTSDNTDPVERQRIQSSLSILYPLSTMGAHVSAAPHQQTLRETSLSTRFNTACFGVLGYELDLQFLTYAEKKEIQEQIAFYKKYRKVFQFGDFSHTNGFKDNQFFWQCTRDNVALTGFFQGTAKTADTHTVLKVRGLKSDTVYTIGTKPQRLFLKRFGGLVKHILPISLDPDGFILRTANRFYTLNDCVETYKASGKLLEQGIFLNNQFTGSYYNTKTQLLGDFGSYLFITKEAG